MSDAIVILKRILSWSRRKPNGCLVCYLGLDKDGYSRIEFKGKTIRTTRVIMHIVKDFNIDSDNAILHKDEICSSRACIEIDHLKEGTWQQNQIERTIKHGNSRSGYFKPFCNRGHKRNRPGVRCRQCAREDYLRRKDK